MRIGRAMFFALLGCDPSGVDAEKSDSVRENLDTGVSATVEDNAPAVDSGLETGASVTWHQDVQPLMGKHCTRCHYEGGLGVGDFEDPVVVAAMAEIMLGQVDAGTMPPPVADPSCRDYEGAGHLQMPAEARNVFATWIDEGKSMGDPAAATPFVPIVETLDDADTVVTIPEPYVPLFEDDRNPGNEYRCFVIDMELEESIHITAMAPLVEQKSMVHHIVLFSKKVEDIPAHEMGPSGYDCIDGGMADNVNGMIAGWAPGAVPIEFPPGYGMKIDPDDRLILQMHYFQSGPDVVGVSDQSGYAFRTRESTDRRVMMFPVGNFDFEIPAGDPAHKDLFQFALPDFLNFDILGIMPHMHVLGSGYRMWLEKEEDDVCLLESDRYDFDNQLTYFFEDPVEVQGGDIISFECTWDNSADNPDQMFEVPQNIGYGERTDEEMCFAFTLIGL